MLLRSIKHGGAIMNFGGKLAVVTGGGSGIGRALVQSLAAQGCSVALCDIHEIEQEETKRLAKAAASREVKITTFVADVADEQQVLAFRDDVLRQHESDHVHLLFNNAGVGGGGSLVTASRSEWDRTFAVCWNGVYNNTRAFLPLLIKADEAHLINVSSVNGFWASLGPDTPHTAYCAAKFAVKGFTEALVTDLKLNAPHVKVSLVMPGHVGTSILLNSISEHGWGSTATEMPEELRRWGENFRDGGLSPERAAEIILNGVREQRWRILVGPDAEWLDQAVRAAPERAYDANFLPEGRRAEGAFP
jgi:NAD(P)-dependent dehydrogenase (short-subunit alcohol dehydrogenase family)